MMKKRYNTPELELITLTLKDVILYSNESGLSDTPVSGSNEGDPEELSDSYLP